MVRTFVGLYRFEIAHVTHDWVFIHDAVCSEQVPTQASAFKSDRNIVAFQHGDVSGFGFPSIFEFRHVKGEELALGDFRDHPGKFFLDELMTGYRLIMELFASECVGTCSFVAVHSSADHAPTDAKTGLREAT